MHLVLFAIYQNQKKIKSNTENVFFENSVNTLNCIKDIHKKGYSENFN